MASQAAVQGQEQREYVVYEDDYISIVWDAERWDSHRVKATLLGEWPPLRAAQEVLRALTREPYSLHSIERYGVIWYVTIVTRTTEYQMSVHYENNDTIIEILIVERGC